MLPAMETSSGKNEFEEKVERILLSNIYLFLLLITEKISNSSVYLKHK